MDTRLRGYDEFTGLAKVLRVDLIARSLDGAQRNPDPPDFAALHPGYGGL